MKVLLKSLVRQAIPPIAMFGAILVLWSIAVWAFGIRSFLLPSPIKVVDAAMSNLNELTSALMITSAAAICGFLASMLLGVMIAFAFSQSSAIRNSCYPYAIFLQTVPMIAIAPLINTWFGSGFHSVVLVSLIISLFPVITSTTKGLLSLDASMLELFQIHDASRWQLLIKLRLPNAVPDIIAGAKTSSGLAVIGAIVGEFFTGYENAGFENQNFGLGYLILLTSDQLKTDKLFASVLASTLLGIFIFAIVTGVGSAIQRRWYSHVSLG